MESKVVNNGYFRVFEDGTVHRLKGYKMGELKPTVSKQGKNGSLTRMTVTCCEDGKQKSYQVAHLILEAFKPIQKNELKQIVYIDGNPLNCHVNNLRYKTVGERKKELSGAIKKERIICSICGKSEIPINETDLCKACYIKEKNWDDRLLKLQDEFKNVPKELLDEEERLILEQRLAGETLQEIGDCFGVTRERIRQRLETMKKGNVYMNKKMSIEEKINLLEEKILKVETRLAKMKLDKEYLEKINTKKSS